jgi:transcriptional regulator with XRE-family HTH domain
MNSAKYLDALKAHLNLSSDYQLAKALGCVQSRLSGYRNDSRTFDDAMAARVAELLGIDPLRVLADMAAERSKNPEVKALWQKIATAAASVLAAVLVGGLAVAPQSAQASTTVHKHSSDAPRLYIMSSRKRRRPRSSMAAMADTLTGRLSRLA